MFVLLFTYVFGGAIARPRRSTKVDFLHAGDLRADGDLRSRDRCRSGRRPAAGHRSTASARCPWRAPPCSRAARSSDTVRNVFVVLMLTDRGGSSGFRFHGGFRPSPRGGRSCCAVRPRVLVDLGVHRHGASRTSSPRRRPGSSGCSRSSSPARPSCPSPPCRVGFSRSRATARQRDGQRGARAGHRRAGRGTGSGRPCCGPRGSWSSASSWGCGAIDASDPAAGPGPVQGPISGSPGCGAAPRSCRARGRPRAAAPAAPVPAPPPVWDTRAGSVAGTG